jgi:hypothetical protein
VAAISVSGLGSDCSWPVADSNRIGLIPEHDDDVMDEQK